MHTTADESRSSVFDILVRSARRVPRTTALVFQDRAWTYAELERGARRVARGLTGLGLQKGDRVAAFGKNSDAYVLLWLACLSLGLVHVPVNFALGGQELAYVLRQSGARAVFVDDALRGPLEASGAAPERVGTLRAASPGAEDVLAWALAPTSIEGFVLPPVEAEDLAQLLYTSGTTAEPKGAAMTHRAFVHHYASSAIALDMRATERPLHALPLYHSAQMHVFLMPALMTGATSWLLETPEPSRVLDTLAAHDLSAFFAPPTVWIALLAELEKDASRARSLKKAYYGASIMPVPVLLRLRELLPDLAFYNCFGQSEIGPLATVLRPEEHDERPASAGRPIPFVDMRVVDDTMQDVAPGEVGEVVYRSPQLCNGYWDKPEETAAAFEGGWFHSGDLARIDAEGFITIVDRKKDIIKTGGVVVASREVEEALFTHPAVREVAVIPLPDPKWIEAVTACVVLKENQKATGEELVAHARRLLAPFKVPKRVHFVEELPRNTAGKLLKRVLRERFGAPK